MERRDLKQLEATLHLQSPDIDIWIDWRALRNNPCGRVPCHGPSLFKEYTSMDEKLGQLRSNLFNLECSFECSCCPNDANCITLIDQIILTQEMVQISIDTNNAINLLEEV